MGISEFDKQRGVGRTSTIFPRIDGDFSLDTQASKDITPGISQATKTFTDQLNEEADLDPWDTNHFGTYIHRLDGVGPAKRMLQTQGEFSASFAKLNRGPITTTTKKTLLSNEAMIRTAEAELSRQRQGLRSGNEAISEHDRMMFEKAATEGFVPDKDSLSEQFDPALRSYEQTLCDECKFTPEEARRLASNARQKLEPVVYQAINTSGVRKPNLFDNLVTFLRTFSPAKT